MRKDATKEAARTKECSAQEQLCTEEAESKTAFLQRRDSNSKRCNVITATMVDAFNSLSLTNGNHVDMTKPNEAVELFGLSTIKQIEHNAHYVNGCDEDHFCQPTAFRIGYPISPQQQFNITNSQCIHFTQATQQQFPTAHYFQSSFPQAGHLQHSLQYQQQQGPMILSEIYHQPSQVGHTYNVLTANPTQLAMHPATFQAPVATVPRSQGRLEYRASISDPSIQYGSYIEPGSISSLNGSTMTGHESSSNSQRGSPRDERLSQTNLYIRKLKDEDTDETIRQILVEAGVLAHNITTTKAVRDDSGSCRSYGFADFCSHEAALDAKEKLRLIRNGELEVSFAKEAEKDPTNVYIRNIPEDDSKFNEQWLSRTFSQYGTVVSSRVLRTNHRDVLRNITIQKPTGTGFVRFERENEALACIEAINTRKQDLLLPPGAIPLDAKLADKGSKKRSHTGGLTNNGSCSGSSLRASLNGMPVSSGSHQLLGYATGIPTATAMAAAAASTRPAATLYMPATLYQTNGGSTAPSTISYLPLQAAAAVQQQQQHHHSAAQLAAAQQMLQHVNSHSYPSYAFMPYGTMSADHSMVAALAAQQAFFYPDLNGHAAAFSAAPTAAIE